jgi:hypothetical protein
MPFNQTNFKVETSDGRNVRLLESFTYVTEVNGYLEKIEVPAGTKSDGASTPKAIWNIIPPFGPHWRAAFLHDYLYRSTKRSRKECDDIFLEAMINLDVDKITRDTIYTAVRAAGDHSFDEDRES